LKNLLSNPGLSFQLPTWSVPGAFQLSVQNATFDGTDLHISVQIQ